MTLTLTQEDGVALGENSIPIMLSFAVRSMRMAGMNTRILGHPGSLSLKPPLKYVQILSLAAKTRITPKYFT
jgi:hypothetical protein